MLCVKLQSINKVICLSVCLGEGGGGERERERERERDVLT